MTGAVEDFDLPLLDRSVWLPHYLPAWSSLADTRAAYAIADSCLTLRIPPEQGLWCAGSHLERLRVSGVQSGNHSGPVGTTRGQQPFLGGQTVAEEQERFEGWLMTAGRFEVRCRMTLSARSMGAVWLSGFEESGRESGELCVVEVFGRSVEPGRSAEVGVGVKRKADPQLIEDFNAPRLHINVAEFHSYAVEWDESWASFLVDDREVRRCDRAPMYAMQVMMAVFDFPGWSTGEDHDQVPELIVDWVNGPRNFSPAGQSE
jgi:Glycosyl hydrolases family 16